MVKYGRILSKSRYPRTVYISEGQGRAVEMNDCILDPLLSERKSIGQAPLLSEGYKLPIHLVTPISVGQLPLQNRDWFALAH